MTIIDEFFSNEMVQWVNRKVDELPRNAKFRAFNAIRSLEWANRVYNIELPIPATYCALHATEEAVAAFVSSAKVAGYGDDAKINIRDHHAKAVVSLMAQKVTTLIRDFAPAVAFHKEQDLIAMRVTVDGVDKYSAASMSAFICYDNETREMSGDFYTNFLATFSDIDELRNLLRRGQEARNSIFYADDTGYPTGFVEPEISLYREAQLTIGLIWASIDLTRNSDRLIPFYQQALRTANCVIEETKKKKSAAGC